MNVPLVFTVDERTAKRIADLRATFGVDTDAAVIRKLIAMGIFASREAEPDGRVRIGNVMLDLKG